MRTIRLTALSLAMAMAIPALVSAQGRLTVFVGGNFGGDSGTSIDESIDDAARLSFGGRLGLSGAGIFGGDIDVGYTPNFYGRGTVFDSSSVLTMMGNMTIGLPAGPVRPYMLAGIGLIRRTVDFASPGSPERASDSRAAYSIGGGVDFFVSGRVGINADFRYFRNFSRGNAMLDLPDEQFNYARGSMGLTIRF